MARNSRSAKAVTAHLAVIIREARERHGYTQEQWAHLLGLSHKQMVQRWEAGACPPRAGAARAIVLLDALLTVLDNKRLPKSARAVLNAAVGERV